MIDGSVTMYDEIIDTKKKVLTTFNEKKLTCKAKKFYILLTFLLITVALLIAVSIYSYLIQN